MTTAVTPELIAFIVFSFITVFSAFMAMVVRKVMISAVLFLITIVFLAVLFLLANSELLFGIQLIVYGGGISILILFAVVLIEEEYIPRDTKQLRNGGILALLALANILFATLTGTPSELPNSIATSNDVFGLVRQFSFFFWNEIYIVIIFVALLLLASMLGSIGLVIRDIESNSFFSDIAQNTSDKNLLSSKKIPEELSNSSSEVS